MVGAPMKTQCRMCGKHYRRKGDDVDRLLIQHEGECVACRARTLYFAECLRNEELIASLRYMAI